MGLGALCCAEEEGVVQDVVLYLLEKRNYLKTVPGKAYLLRAVKHTALRRLLSAAARYTVFMDPESLLIAERKMYAVEHGQPNADKVRLG